MRRPPPRSTLFPSTTLFQSIAARRKSEILAADHAQSAHVAKIRPLTYHCARNLHPDVHVVFRHSHVRVSFVTGLAPTRPIGLVGAIYTECGRSQRGDRLGAGPG